MKIFITCLSTNITVAFLIKISKKRNTNDPR